MMIPQDIPLQEGQHVELRGKSHAYPGSDYYAVFGVDGLIDTLWCQDGQGTVWIANLRAVDFGYHLYHKQGGNLFS